MRLFLLSLTLVSLIAATAVVPAAASAGQPTPTCEKQPNELVRSYRGAVYMRNGVLYGCTGQYAENTVTRRLGSWNRRGDVVFDGRFATWTTRTRRGVAAKDWVTSIDVGTGDVRFRNAAPVPGSPYDDRVLELRTYSLGVSWFTARGTLVMSIPAERRKPTPIGAETASASGLNLPLRPIDDTRLIVGHWPGSPRTTADTLQMDSIGGAGDQCGGISSPTVTVRPDASQPPVGARWDLQFRTGFC